MAPVVNLAGEPGGGCIVDVRTKCGVAVLGGVDSVEILEAAVAAGAALRLGLLLDALLSWA